MAKDKTFMKTGEAAEYVGVSTQTLRDYERKGLLEPHMKRESGHRIYTRQQLDEFIREQEKAE